MINAFSVKGFSLKYVRTGNTNAPLGVVVPAGASEKEFMMLLLFHSAAHYVPINDSPKGIYMIGTTVLIVEIISMFPNIEAQ